MAQSRVKLLFSLLAFTSVLAGALLFFLYQQASKVTVESLRNDGFFIYDAPSSIAEFSLVDQDGDAFTNSALEGQWSLVFFGYTFCPDICPLTMATIRQFYSLLEENGKAGEVQVIMVSVDPERDTPQVLANYVRYFNPEFIGATGDYARVYTLARQMNVTFNYTRVDDENYLVNHNGEVMLINPDGENIGFFKPPYDPGAMLENFSRARRFSAQQR